ncbi:hypothetical protein C2G38_2203010 [Gigaspora rosea]|uniref:Uncharacterized protein n=1 Tax=Gigaspora rosea TaxID=44941 RepID=A0A397UQJ7_9GLOM|nr:hypothetical protein C2G38_2203010 [Gigaspora rosea]
MVMLTENPKNLDIVDGKAVVGALVGGKSSKKCRNYPAFKKCTHFADKTTPEEKEEIFALSNSKGISNENGLLSLTIPYPTPRSLLRHEKSLLTISCGIAFHWVNNPETKELFQFLNPHLKLPDR